MYKYKDSIGGPVTELEQVKALKRDLEAYTGILMDFVSPYLDPTTIAQIKPVMIYDIQIYEKTYGSLPKLVVYFLMDGEKKSIFVVSNSDFHTMFQPHIIDEFAL